MDTFPLNAFLNSLQLDGFRLTIRDYERIQLVFSLGGEWSIERLREVLLALLVKSSEEETKFLRRFARHFEVDPQTENKLPENIDLNKILQDLKALAQEDPPLSKYSQEERKQEEKSPQPTFPAWSRIRPRFWFLYGVLLLFAGLFWTFPLLFPPAPTLDLQSESLIGNSQHDLRINFGEIEMGQVQDEVLVLSNNGFRALELESLFFWGNNQNYYSVS